MKVRLVGLAVGLAGLLAACSPEPLFPPYVMKTVDPAMQFGIYNAEADTYLRGHMVQIGGRIVSAAKLPDGIQIVAHELPVRNPSSRGPAESESSPGTFVVLYPGAVDPQGLQTGNKLVLVGEMQGTHTITVHESPRTVPYLVARCLHIWKTGTHAISEFPHLPSGYYPLEEQTYCLQKP